MARDRVTVKMEFTGKEVKPIDIPNGVKLIVAYKDDVKHFPENIMYTPSIEVTVAVVGDDFCVIDSGGCNLVVKDGEHEVVLR